MFLNMLDMAWRLLENEGSDEGGLDKIQMAGCMGGTMILGQ